MAHWCSLVWIFSTLNHASSGDGQSASVFTVVLLIFQPVHCGLLAPFAMWPAFPTSDYYRASVPSRLQQPTAGLPVTGLAGRCEGETEMVPTFTTIRSTGEVPSFAPATSPRVRRRPSSWPPDRHYQTGGGVALTGVRCVPTHVHQV